MDKGLRISAGTISTSHAVHGEIDASGGTITDHAGLFGVALQSGGTITNSFACKLLTIKKIWMTFRPMSEKA